MLRCRCPNWRPHRSIRLGTPGLLIALTLLPGGACAPPKKHYNPPAISKNGADLYKSALQQRWESQARDERGQDQRKSLAAVVASLEAAVHNDPDCPLFHSKLGEVLLEHGQADLAEDEFQKSLDLCENDWVPGWLGLARWAGERIHRDSSKVSEAEYYLMRAEGSISNIEEHWGELPPDERGMPGLGKLGLTDDSSTAVISPDRSGGWRVIDMLGANEHPALFAGTSVFGRMRARIVYERALIADARGEPAATVIENLKKSHRFDPDFVPAQIERARQHYKRAEYDMAEDILLPVLRREALYQNSAELWFELARIYAQWCLESFGDDQCFEAEKAFARVQEINDNHMDSWLARAQMNYAVGARNSRKDVLLRAKEMVDVVLGMNANDPEAGKLVQQIDEAIKELTPEGDK